jgi:hypothetical protein
VDCYVGECHDKQNELFGSGEPTAVGPGVCPC